MIIIEDWTRASRHTSALIVDLRYLAAPLAKTERNLPTRTKQASSWQRFVHYRIPAHVACARYTSLLYADVCLLHATLPGHQSVILLRWVRRCGSEYLSRDPE